MRIAGLAVRRPPRRTVCLLLAACLALLSALPVFSASDSGLPSSPGATNSVYLEYTIAPEPLMVWGLTLNREPKPFQREPDTAGRKVCRASFYFNVGDQPTALLWDYSKGKLWLDLNHDRDLTDDPEGVLSCPVGRLNYYYQSFTNAHLTLKTSRGSYPLCVNLNLFGADGPNLGGNAGFRSFWAGKITLGNREYQVGRVDNPGQFGLDNQGSLLVRPWEQRAQPWDMMNGSLDAFPYSQNLFFNGQAYRFDCTFLQQDPTPRFKLVFREKQAELGEVKLAGKFIERLVLTGRAEGNRNQTVFTVVLDNPGPVASIPIGRYDQSRVSLRAGAAAAHTEAGGGTSRPNIEVAADRGTPPTLNIGGPLTNSVSAGSQGRHLMLNYQLLGSGGAVYQLNNLDRSHPPRFVIYKKGKAIHSGQFEFG